MTDTDTPSAPPADPAVPNPLAGDPAFVAALEVIAVTAADRRRAWVRAAGDVPEACALPGHATATADGAAAECCRVLVCPTWQTDDLDRLAAHLPDALGVPAFRAAVAGHAHRMSELVRAADRRLPVSRLITPDDMAACFGGRE